MSGEIKHVQLGKLEDLVKMMATSISPPPLHHVKAGDKHIYFIPASLGMGKAVIYFVKSEEAIEKKYVAYDTIHDKIAFSDEVSTKPSLKQFLIIWVEAQNILPKEVL